MILLLYGFSYHLKTDPQREAVFVSVWGLGPGKMKHSENKYWQSACNWHRLPSPSQTYKVTRLVGRE